MSYITLFMLINPDVINGLGSDGICWSPLGVTSKQVAQFHCDERYQVLPAYSQDGIVLSRAFCGSTNAYVF
jgi:hypothetical protein